MSTRVSPWLAWSLAALCVGMFITSIALIVLSLSGASGTQPSSEWGLAGPVGGLVAFSPFLTFPLVGALIASRRPKNPIGWICLVAGLFWMLSVLGAGYDAYELSRPGPDTSSVTFDALFRWVWVPPVGLLGIYMILLFPDGALPSKRWRPFAFFAGVVIALACVAVSLDARTLEGHPGVRKSLGLEVFDWLQPAAVFVVFLLPVCILVSAASLVLRYRRSGAEVRHQIKWVVFAALLVGVVYLSTLVVGLLFAPEAIPGGDVAPLWLSILQAMVLLSYAGVPVAMGFAVLKYRLYDIDLIINRTLVYGALTATVLA